MDKIKKILYAYRYLFCILKEDCPLLLLITIILSVIQGICPPLVTWSVKQIIDKGVLVAKGGFTFKDMLPVLVLFSIASLAPSIINIYIQGFVQSRSQLILRTSFRAKMIGKLKKLKYEHFENPESMEIIDKAFNRTENAARMLFPMYFTGTISSLVSVLGSFYLLVQVEWWLILTVLIPFLLEFYFSLGLNYDIYDQLESYWNMDYSNGILGKCLSTREIVKENRLHQATDYLVSEYQTRQYRRNREYEKYYLKHLRKILTSGNLARISIIFNVFLLLWMQMTDKISLGALVSLSLLIFDSIYEELNKTTVILEGGPYHVNTFEYYERYFDLSENSDENKVEIPESGTIEFKNVWFRYPGTDKYILKGLSFKVEDGEKISIVGENGEGKTTMIKLLLGLFSPDKGEILIGGKSIEQLKSSEKISQLCGTVFQDFMRYSINARENITVGDIENIYQEKDIEEVAKKVNAYNFIQNLPNKWDTILNRMFEKGVDLSGGQWQRIAMARAVLGDKKILILDEPTSQLDPLSESKLYQDFAKLTNGKTSIFITHRLGSTAICDRILVISEGKVVQSGTHEELVNSNGLYASMFNAQKHWYTQQTEG